MRIKRPLEALFPRMRRLILGALFRDRGRWWYLSDLAEHLHVRPSSLQRELAALTAAGILRTRRDGKRVYYQPDPECPITMDLQGLFLRTTGLADVLREVLTPFLTDIDVAFVYGSVARGEEHAGSDVDLMVIGRLPLVDAVPALRTAEQSILRPVNATLYSRDEFIGKLRAGHHFLCQVMDSEKIFVKGNADELVQIVGGTPSSDTRGDFAGVK